MNARQVTTQFVIGALAFAAIQYALFFLSAGWFLDSGRSAAIVVVVLAAVSAVVTLAAPRSNMLHGAGAFAAGAIAAMVVTLFIIGPGTIFPIVIAVGGACIVIAAFGGGYAGSAVRSLFGPRVP